MKLTRAKTDTHTQIHAGTKLRSILALARDARYLKYFHRSQANARRGGKIQLTPNHIYINTDVHT